MTKVQVPDDFQFASGLASKTGRDRHLEAVLHALKHPKAAVKPNEPVSLGKGQKLAFSGTGS